MWPATGLSMMKTIMAKMTDSAGGCVFRPSAKDLCAFLSDYAGWLFSCGATCVRLEKNVGRIASAAGLRADLSIFPRHLHITVSDSCRSFLFTAVSSIHDCPVNFAMNTRLSKLSWDIADGNVDFVCARRELEEITTAPAGDNGRLPLMVACANGAFCRLFGGDAVAMAVVFVATFAGFIIKQVMGERRVDQRVTVVVCSFVSSVLAAADGLFALGSTPSIAIGTSVLYLVPGIPFINSFCDVVDSHYICAFGRLMNALVITACLSAGLCGGMVMMNVGMF